ncbi:MAG TPA: xanthine dehydrogenase, partial [Myxococcales bacterium]|nr:xanthine dehydrogenase [Myxococcales bacterium]
KRSRYQERRKLDRVIDIPETGARIRRGVGLSYFFHGAGFTGNGEAYLKGKVALELVPGGQVLIKTASTDIDQGTVTIFPQIAGDTLGISPQKIIMVPPDTSQVPDSGPTVASRTTMVVGKVVMEAAREIKEKIDAFKPGQPFSQSTDAYLKEVGPLRVDATFQSPPDIEWNADTYQGDAYPCYGWAADMVEVEVDLDTAEVRITEFVTAHDAGKVIHPVLAEGQVEGGSLQALAWACMEEVVLKNGRMWNDRMTNYIIPTSLDAPEMDVDLVEAPYEYGPFGAKGIGEMPMDGGVPAVFAAIEHALGIPLPDVCPLMPERLIQVIEESS